MELLWYYAFYKTNSLQSFTCSVATHDAGLKSNTLDQDVQTFPQKVVWPLFQPSNSDGLEQRFRPLWRGVFILKARPPPRCIAYVSLTRLTRSSALLSRAAAVLGSCGSRVCLKLSLEEEHADMRKVRPASQSPPYYMMILKL